MSLLGAQVEKQNREKWNTFLNIRLALIAIFLFSSFKILFPPVPPKCFQAMQYARDYGVLLSEDRDYLRNQVML